MTNVRGFFFLFVPISPLELISSPLLAGVSQPPVLPFLASSQTLLVVYGLPLPILDLGLLSLAR